MPKKIIAFMGSPRKNRNTGILMQEALRGANALGAETKLVHIAALTMKGCQGCYACKTKGDTEGKCVLKDDMTPLYQEVEEADAVLFGSPVYMCAMTSELKMVLDRLFPYLTMDFESLLPKGKKCGLIFTQNQRDPNLFEWHFQMTARMLTYLGFEEPEILVSIDTIGYDDVEKLAGTTLIETHRRKKHHKATVFPNDMRKAYDMGQRMARST